MKTFGKILKNLREEKEWTQDDLAAKLNVKPSTVGNYENDRRFPDQATLKKIRDLFDVTLDYLLGESELKRGRLVTVEELKSFLPPEVVKKYRFELWVNDEQVGLSKESKKEVIQYLKNKGIIK